MFRNHFLKISLFVRYRCADKSLAQPTSRCRKTEPIVSFEANLLVRANDVYACCRLSRNFRGMKGELCV